MTVRANTTRRLLWLSVVALAGAGIWFVVRARPLVAETAVVKREPLVATVVDEGRVRVRQLYVVASPIDGELERISVEPGDAVRPGSPVARIWPVAPRPLDARSQAEAFAAVNTAKATVVQAIATRNEAQAALTHAQSQLESLRKLAVAGAGTTQDAEHAGHEVELRRRAVETADAAIKTAENELARAEALAATNAGRNTQPAAVVAAPAVGRVLRVLHESAGPISAGTPLLEVGDVTAIEVVADFLTADALAMRPGADAMITDWGGSGAIHARVRRVDPAAFTKVSALGLEEQRVPVLDLVDPPAGLGHGFHVSVSVTVWSSPSAVVVPSTALFRVGDKWAVFSVQAGRAHLIIVALGASDGSRTVIDGGLDAGTPVIVQPSDVIRDGTKIAPGTSLPRGDRP